jgi:hypothetical protein
MRKFIVHSRPIPGHIKSSDAPTVVEVEGELITAMEDATILWLPKGEFKFRITKPEWLYEPTNDKKLTPPVYYSHACYWSSDQAHVFAERMVRHGFEFAERKQGIKFSDEEVKAKFSEITELLLPRE